MPLLDGQTEDMDDLRFYIKQALQYKISWAALKFLLEDINSKNGKSKQIIEVLIDELKGVPVKPTDHRPTTDLDHRPKY